MLDKVPTIEVKVQKGTTLSEIAAKYGTSVKGICEASNIFDEDKIKAGQTVKVPLKQEELNYYDRKLKGWDAEVEEKRILLLDQSLSAEEREKLQKEYNDLKSKNEKRKRMADVELTKDKEYVIIHMKGTHTAKQVRETFKITPGALRGFIEKNHRVHDGNNWQYDEALIYSSDDVKLPVEYFNQQGRFTEFLHTWFGYEK